MLYNSSSASVDKLANKITENQMITISHGEATTAVTQPVYTIWWIEEGAKKNKLLSLLEDDTFYR